MSNKFFKQPILNSPYKYPFKHWELDETGQPTQRIIEKRRRAEFITPFQNPGNRKETSNRLRLSLMKAKGFLPRSKSMILLPC